MMKVVLQSAYLKVCVYIFNRTIIFGVFALIAKMKTYCYVPGQVVCSLSNQLATMFVTPQLVVKSNSHYFLACLRLHLVERLVH